MKTITTTIILIFVIVRTGYSQIWNAGVDVLIGQTFIGMQSERSVPRLIANNGFSVSTCWSIIPSGTWDTTRAVNYANLFQSGIIASAANNIQPKMANHPNIDSRNGWEYILASSADSGMVLSKRIVGTGSWTHIYPAGTFNLFPGQQDEWCRMSVGGANGNSIHIIANSQGNGNMPVLNQHGPLTYTRSEDGGATWNIDHIRLPQCDETFFLGFNKGNYAIDSRGDVVAVVAGGFNMELCMWKSVDNGTNWTKTIVFPFPVPLYDDTLSILDPNNDGVADTVETSGQDPTVIVDVNGVVHVSFGRMRIYDGIVSGKAVYDPYADGLYYWNENMVSPVIVANAEDLNGNGKIDFPEPVAPNTLPVGIYFSGLLMQPSLASDSSGIIFLAYSSVNELADTSIFQCMHKHIYIISSGNMGITWTPPQNIVPLNAVGGDGEFQEAVLGSLAKDVGYNGNCLTVDMVYFRDGAPYYANGNLPSSPSLIQEQWNEDANAIPLPVDVVFATITCINGIAENMNNPFSISPNPASNQITISGFGNDETNISVSLFTPDGRLVEEKSFFNSHKVKMDVSDLIPGIYIVKIATDKQVSSELLVRSSE